MPNFPIILYPEPIKEFLQSVKAEIPSIPPLPEAPTLKKALLEPQVNQFSQTTLLQLALVVNFLLLAVGIFLTKLPMWLLILLLLSCSCTLIVVKRKLTQGQFYPKSLLHQEANQLKEYEQQLRVDKKSLDNRIKIQQQYNKTIDDHRKKLPARLAQSLMLPQGYSTAQQGASEAQFKHYLDRYFPNHIHQGFKLPIPESELSYSADFTYVDGVTHLYIDIEIDEPYYYETKSPTHCCDQDKDQKRNAFFVKNNWVVIRFAEEQVVRYPNRCCFVIARVVAEITGSWELFNKFKDVPELPSVKQWTMKEARRMAKAKYRGKYLTSFSS